MFSHGSRVVVHRDMSAATSSTPPLGNAGKVDASPHSGRDAPPKSPERLPSTIVAQSKIREAGAVGSPVRRSPRLSRLPPPQSPVESQDTHDPDESSDNGSESVNDVALQHSREETPENDDLPPDEPSTILASKIMRAHDNPSPPPQDLAHPGVNYVPGKDGQFPPPGVYIPPSPFRPINLLERMNQLSHRSFDPPRSPRTSILGARPDTPDSGIMTLRGFIPPESSSPFIASVPMRSPPQEDPASADTIPSSFAQCTVNDLPPRSSQHVCKPANLVNDDTITIISSPEPKFPSPPLTQGVDSSSNLIVPSSSNDHPRDTGSERRQSGSKSSPLPLNAETLSSSPANEYGKASLGTGTVVPGGKYNDGKDALPFSKSEQESKSEPTSTKEVDAKLLQRLGSLSPHSTKVFAGLCIPPEPTSSIQLTNLAAESIRSEQPSVTQPRTPMPSAMHPDFSRTSVQQPVIAPTPVRANSARKLDSPTKLSFQVDDIYRTPARRVPIETVLAHGTSSFQKTVQLSTDQSRSRPFLTIGTPVFTRPVLDDPSRSPAKRIPIPDLVPSPTRGHQAQSSPTRLGLRARSASVEPRPLGITLTRSRSVEPCATTSKPDNHTKFKESIFPIAPALPRAATKLPFPLVTGKKPSSDPPPPIPEEHEGAEAGNAETDATSGRVMSGSSTSQLRQPSTSSRIPRIGNKPYARPQKAGKATLSTATASTTCASRAPPFQLARKNDGVGNSNAERSSTQPTNDQRSVGSLKRKRGTEATALPNSHPVMIRKVVPENLSKKCAPKPAKFLSQVQAPPESSPPKVPQPLKFRKVVDGTLSARYVPAKANSIQTGQLDTPFPPSPLSELSSSSNEGSFDEKPPPTLHPPTCPKSETSGAPGTDVDACAVEPNTHEPLLHQNAGAPSSRPRRTSRTRKPAQQQYLIDVFNGNTSRPPPRRKPPSRTEGDYFVGMNATALKALTTSNTTKNQQTVAVLATEVIRKEGLRPESPTVKARTILQKQRDERDVRRRERARRRDQMSEEGLEGKDTEGQAELDDRGSLSPYADRDESDCAVLQKHRRGPGDEEDYKTPERSQCIIEPLRLEGMNRQVKPVKQVKWHRGLSTAVYLDEIDPKPKSLLKNAVVRGCLAPTSKNLPLDSLGNLLDLDNRPFPELVTEHIAVKKFLYDNDIELEPIPAKVTRSKNKKSQS